MCPRAAYPSVRSVKRHLFFLLVFRYPLTIVMESKDTTPTNPNKPKQTKAMNHQEMMSVIALPDDFEKPKMRGDIDGNAFSVLANTTRTLKRAGHSDIAERLSSVALKGDYNALLATCSACVEFVFPEYEGLDEDEDEDC